MAQSNVVLTIAGSDSSSGAGIQADIKSIAANDCYGATVITALTAQNTTGVQGVHPCPPKFVEEQMDSVFADLDIQAIKIGMLCDAEIAKTVFQNLKFRSVLTPSPPLVCDPVCVSTSGHTLLHEDALDVLISGIFPLSTLVTPNKSETELLLARIGQPLEIKDLKSMFEASVKLSSEIGCSAVLVKGGHVTTRLEDVRSIQQEHPNLQVIKQGLLGENMEILQAECYSEHDLELVADILHQNVSGRTTLFVRPRISSSSTHGTGCTLSSAIASQLAKGSSIEMAVQDATMYTHHGIQTAAGIGKGHGPLNHFHNITPSLIPRRTATNPYPFAQLLIQSAAATWKEYVEHVFVRQLGKGTLDRDCFLHFIKQDYHYLKYYARAYGLLAAKVTSFSKIRSATETILNVLHEIGNHKTYCSSFGITEAELESTPESAATMAYGAYLIDTGLQGDSTKLIMALMACLLGYGEVGLWLKKQSTQPDSWVVLEGNPYKNWIEEYSGKMYQDAVRTGLQTIEACAEADPPSPSRLKEWKEVWARCTRLEIGFWDMAMELSK